LLVLFDLDGTLTDPGLGITRSLQHALASLGRPAPPADSLLRFIGPPLGETFATLLATRDADLIARAVERYRERYATAGLYENVVYPDVPPALARLRRGGHRMRLVTSKPEVYAARVLRHFGLDGFFDGVHGPQLAALHQDKADLVRGALEAGGASPRDAVLVGDRIHDVAAARAHGVAAIAVRWGYGPEAELEGARPDAVAAQMDDVCTWVEARG
jgi:phosphoglycolate phosphatase